MTLEKPTFTENSFILSPDLQKLIRLVDISPEQLNSAELVDSEPPDSSDAFHTSSVHRHFVISEHPSFVTPVHLIVREEPQFEEDLKALDSKTIIAPEKIKEITHNVQSKVLKSLGKYVNPSYLQLVFPGIDINNIEDYDFNNSKIKYFVLGEEDAQIIDTEYRRVSSSTSAFSILPIEIVPYKKATEIIITTPPYTVVAREVSRMYSTGNSEKIVKHLTHRLTHETLHLLSVGSDLPLHLMEAITELYTLSIVDDTAFPYFSDETFEENAGYQPLVLGVTSLLRLLSASVDVDIFGKAFVGRDAKSLDIIRNRLIKIVGAESLRAIFDNEHINNTDGFYDLVLRIIKQQKEQPV